MSGAIELEAAGWIRGPVGDRDSGPDFPVLAKQQSA
jgi:hypothetical protein